LCKFVPDVDGDQVLVTFLPITMEKFFACYHDVIFVGLRRAIEVLLKD